MNQRHALFEEVHQALNKIDEAREKLEEELHDDAKQALYRSLHNSSQTIRRYIVIQNTIKAIMSVMGNLAKILDLLMIKSGDMFPKLNSKLGAVVPRKIQKKKKRIK